MPDALLTGSSARKLRRGGVDLLAGRALHRTLHPFMAGELPSFSLEGALRDGLLPLVVTSPTPGDVLDAYASLYLEQEVKLEGWARDAGSLSRFLEAISFSHGRVLNVANVARECEIARPTVSAYVEVLEDLLLSFRIPVFTRRARRETSAHPKLYVFAWVAYSGSGAELFFWRTRPGVEVDFVVYGPRGFWAIQVQNSSQVRPAELRALRTFHADYPECARLLLYRGSERRRIEGVLCLPVEEFLRELHPSRGLTASVAELNSSHSSPG